MDHENHDGGVRTRRFRIWVQGRLGEGFSQGLAGIEQEDVSAGTLLTGPMLDQSKLHSTLDLLRSLGIDVLRFEVDSPRVPSGTVPSDYVEAAEEIELRGFPHPSIEWPIVRDDGENQEKDR